MKRLVIALFFVMALVTASWCASPTVTLTATYTDDNSSVSFDAVEPYREVKFSYSIADALSASYSITIQTTKRSARSSGSISSTTLPLVIETTETFVSEESGDITMSVTVTGVGSASKVQRIRVKQGEPPVISVSGIKIGRYGSTLIYPPAAKMELEVRLNSYESLTAYVEPENATNKNVIWSSDNPAVATVSSSGRVDGKYPGKATVTATTEDGGHVASCDVSVVGSGADSMYLNPSEITLEVGAQASVWIVASNFADYQFDSVVWTVSDDTIVKVVSSEYSRPSRVWGINGMKAGTTTITAKTINTRGEPMKASCTVTVTAPESPSQPDNPSQPSNPTQPNTPSQPNTPTQTDSPTQTDTPSQTDNPTEPESPSEPVDTVDPVTGAPIGQKVGGSSGGSGCNGLLGLATMLPVLMFKRKR